MGASNIRPRASIIILAYNQEKTIGRAIESVLRQKCKYPFEILIADDGSPDASREIAQQYADKYPDIIRMMPLLPNRGIVGNYFDAFEACRGDYIGDCAGDDEWLSDDRLERQIEALDANPNLSVVFTDVEEYHVDANGNVNAVLQSTIPGRNRYMKPILPGREALIGVLNNVHEIPYVLSAALYRRDALMTIYAKDKGAVRSPAVGVEDLPVMAALGSVGDASYLPVVGLRYYIEGESVSNNLPHLKIFNLYCRVTRETYRLSEYYHVDKALVADHVKSKIDYLASQIDHAAMPSLIPELDDICRMWGAKYSLRARAHLALAYIRAWKRRMCNHSK